MSEPLFHRGWIPDVPDIRDHYFSTTTPSVELPTSVSLREWCPTPYDQGNLGSCTAQAIAAALEIHQRRHGAREQFTPSRLFIYYNERVMENTVHEDAGAMIRDGIKSIAKDGAPHEVLWPYTIAKFARRPTVRAYRNAKRHTALRYARVPQTEWHIKSALASGTPIIFGFAVFESLYHPTTMQTGAVEFPQSNDRMLGGHAVLAVGYDDATQRVTFLNSWGSAWGDAGYGTLPYTYMSNDDLAADLWVIQDIVDVQRQCRLPKPTVT